MADNSALAAANQEEKNFNETLKSSLRKMIKSCDTYIKEAKNMEQLQDNLKHMEEIDENFHKYELVQILNDKLDSCLGDLIDRNVNDAFGSSKFDGDIDSQNKIAERICQDIIKNKEFTDFKKSFQQNTNKAIDFLLKNFQSNFMENPSEELTIHENENKSISFSNDLEYSSPDNSMNQNSFVFVTSEQFPKIALDLDPRKSEEDRMKAIQQLLAIPASDPQATEHWILIRQYLIYALRDTNEKIAEMCLKLHSRNLASSHYKVSAEIYVNLIEHLSEYFRDKELEKRLLRPNVDLTTPDNNFLLKIFRLLNDYAKDVPSKWTRYPDSFIETIISETIKLLCMACEYKIGNYLTPLHYLSLLDVHANWFTKWMHGHDSRKILISIIKKNELFLQTVVNSVYHYSLANSKKPEQQLPSFRKKSLTLYSSQGTNKRTLFKKGEIEYTHFVHSLNIIRKILCFKNGRLLFKDSIKISNRDVTIKDLIKAIIQIIFDTANFKALNDFSPSKCAYDLLQDLCVTEDTCEACLCNEEVIEQLLKPIKSILQSKKNSQVSSLTSSSSNFNLNSPTSFGSGSAYLLNVDESCLLLIANILSKLASTECGYRQLLFNDSSKNYCCSTLKNTAAHTIVSFVEKAIKNQLNTNLSTAELIEYLYLCRLLYSKCQGVFLIREYSLNKLITDSWHQNEEAKPPPVSGKNGSSSSATNTPRQVPNREVSAVTYSEALLDNLVSMASTPRGVHYLNETKLVDRVVNYMFNRYKSRLQVGKYEKFGYGFIISQLANAPSGTFYMNERNFVQHLIDEIWTELEHGSDDFMSAFPRSYSVESIDREVYKPMLCLINIMSSFSSVYELLLDISITPREVYGKRDVPKELVGLLDRCVILDKKTKISSLCNFEQSHMFGLKLINFLLSDLDLLLLLEAQYGISKMLLSLQKANRPNSMATSQNDLLDSENGPLASTNSNENFEEEVEEADPCDKSNIIIDSLSVERNLVLVNANLIGGPSEKLIPFTNFNDVKKFSYNYPLFDQLPVPNVYIRKIESHKHKTSKEFKNLIDQFEESAKMGDSKWLKKFQSVYLESIRSGDSSVDILGKALDQYVQILVKVENPTASSQNIDESHKSGHHDLSNIQKLGLEKIVQYGIQIGQLDKMNKDECVNSLFEVHKKVKNMLSSSANLRKKTDANVESSYLAYGQEDTYPGFDWFTSIVFLLNRGDSQLTLKFLHNFQRCERSFFIWTSNFFSLIKSQPATNVYLENGISLLLSTTCHYIELILKIELPLVFSAFRMSGLAPSQVCLHWLKQCFLNYLDWHNIVSFLALCIVYGVDYQTYYCVCLLRHLNNNHKMIIQHHTNKDLQFFMRENQIENFRLEHHLDYMIELESKYRSYIHDDIKQAFQSLLQQSNIQTTNK